MQSCLLITFRNGKGYHLIISNPDIGFLGFGREFKCFARFEVCKYHAIIHDACGAARTKYNVGAGYRYVSYLSNCCRSSPLIGHITGLFWCWRHRTELKDIFGTI